MPSESSSPDDLFAPGAEAYYRKVLKLDEPKAPLSPEVAEGSHVHEWGAWAPYDTDRREVYRLNPMEQAYCACGASKARLAEADHEDACPVRTGEEGPRQGMCLCHVEKEAPKAVEAEVPPTPRPPYAVAYAVQGGALYEVALPGDATAAAEGGRLVITHSGMPVTGIVRVAPMRIEEA